MSNRVFIDCLLLIKDLRSWRVVVQSWWSSALTKKSHSVSHRWRHDDETLRHEKLKYYTREGDWNPRRHMEWQKNKQQNHFNLLLTTFRHSSLSAEFTSARELCFFRSLKQLFDKSERREKSDTRERLTTIKTISSTKIPQILSSRFSTISL